MVPHIHLQHVSNYFIGNARDMLFGGFLKKNSSLNPVLHNDTEITALALICPTFSYLPAMVTELVPSDT